MEHPVREIAGVITALTTGSPAEQQDTLNAYFLSDAAFSHPFCRVPAFARGTIPLAPNLDSRWLLLGIYRWYRTLSPAIDISIDSAVFDQRTGQLFVSIRQTFAICFMPFYKAPVRLVTVLQLVQRSAADSGEAAGARGSAALAGPGQERARFFIARQEDLYTINDCAQFLLPGLGPLLCFSLQLYSTALCVVGSLVFMPLYLLMNRGAEAKKLQ